MIPHAFVSIYLAGIEDTPPATEQVRYDMFVQGLFKPGNANEMLMHAALGVCGEAGELADAIKKQVVYNKPADRANIVEEIGDLQFYIQELMNLYDITPNEVFQGNADKLSKRYVGLKYSDRAAIERADKSTEPPRT